MSVFLAVLSVASHTRHDEPVLDLLRDTYTFSLPQAQKLQARLSDLCSATLPRATKLIHVS